MTTSSLPLPDDAASGCCAPVTEGVLTPDDAATLATRFKAIGDPTRLRLLSMVAAAEGGEACVCDLNESLDLSQGTVSHHLGLLVKAGLLSRTKRGVWSYSAIVPGSLPALADTLRA